MKSKSTENMGQRGAKWKNCDFFEDRNTYESIDTTKLGKRALNKSRVKNLRDRDINLKQIYMIS